MSLFSQIPDEGTLKRGGARTAPLAERMRPRTLDDYVGQEHLLGPGKPLRVEIERDDAGSMILWGPPGVGKTTLAKIIAETTQASFIEFSAVMGGIKEIKQVMVDAEKAAGFGSRTILFIDEIHRFNKAQQDAFLPYVERGTIRLIGATTENPSFEVIAALLSRCRVYRLTPLSDEQLMQLLKRALADKERGLGKLNVTAQDDAMEMISSYANGDARYAYNALETAAKLAAGGVITREIVQNALQQRVLLYDKQGEEHFNLISALHKSIRNSDADASLYWLGRMLQGRRRPHVCCPATGTNGSRGHWPGGAGGAADGTRGPRRDGFSGLAGRRSGPGPGRRLPGAGAQIECALYRLWRDNGGDRSPSCGAGAAPLEKRAYAADGAIWIRRGLPVCS